MFTLNLQELLGLMNPHQYAPPSRGKWRTFGPWRRGLGLNFNDIALRQGAACAHPLLIAACAAASRAMGTRKGEQDT